MEQQKDKRFGNVWENAQIEPGTSGGVKEENIMKPEAHRILHVTHETAAEFTFRVSFPYQIGRAHV